MENIENLYKKAETEIKEDSGNYRRSFNKYKMKTEKEK